MTSQKFSSIPQLLCQSWKDCKSKKERIILRICKLIASNLIEKALNLMIKFDININIIFVQSVEEDFLIDEKRYIEVNFSICGYRDDIYTTCSTFLSVACTFSSFESINKLCKAGADIYNDSNEFGYLSILHQNPVIIIPQLQSIFSKYKPKAKVFFKSSIINKVDVFIKKGRFALLNKLIAIGDYSSAFNKPISQKEKINKLYKNTGLSKALTHMNISYGLRLCEKGEDISDYFYQYLCHTYEVPYINTSNSPTIIWNFKKNNNLMV